MVTSHFERVTPQCKVENFQTTVTQRKTDAYIVYSFCGHWNTVNEAMGCYYHYCPCQKARRALFEKQIQRGTKRRELDELRKQYIQAKAQNVIEMCECDWWKM